MMKGVAATYFTSPQGQEMIQRYLSSDEGNVATRQYLATPRGKQTARMILPLILDALDLPDDVKILVRRSLGENQD
jgi:hypothetical protein